MAATDQKTPQDPGLSGLVELNVSDIRFVAWDTETTGMDSETCHVVELAALAFDEDFEHRRFETLVKPPVGIAPDAEAVHGIGDAMVATAPGAGDALRGFFEFLQWVGAPRILIAHNAGFDVGFVHAEVRRAGGIKLEGGVLAREIVLDTYRLAKTLLPDLPSHRLDALVDHFQLPAVGFHRALEDARALQGVFLKLLGLAADRASTSAKGLTAGALTDLAGGYFVLGSDAGAAKRKSFHLPPRLQALEALCGTGARVRITYEREEDVRYVTPLGIRIKGKRAYLEAYCHRDGVEKTFRTDRILSFSVVT